MYPLGVFPAGTPYTSRTTFTPPGSPVESIRKNPHCVFAPPYGAIFIHVRGFVPHAAIVCTRSTPGHARNDASISSANPFNPIESHSIKTLNPPFPRSVKHRAPSSPAISNPPPNACPISISPTTTHLKTPTPDSQCHRADFPSNEQPSARHSIRKTKGCDFKRDRPQQTSRDISISPTQQKTQPNAALFHDITSRSQLSNIDQAPPPQIKTPCQFPLQSSVVTSHFRFSCPPGSFSS